MAASKVVEIAVAVDNDWVFDYSAVETVDPAAVEAHFDHERHLEV